MGLVADLIHGLKDLEGTNQLKPRPQTSDDQALMYTTRTETDGTLEVYDGNLPADMNGVFYTIYPVGSVNSGGLPFPETINGQYNPEFGTPIMNGDGLVVSITFDGTQDPPIRSRLVKTPCFFADYNTRKAAPLPGSNFGFLNFGLSRMSLSLGARNLSNTALIPVKFGNSAPFLLTTYDIGRPFILDAKELKLLSPVGSTTDWMPATPTFLNWPFPVVQTTAHPSFDPNTEEVFSVNYTKSATANEYLIAQKTAQYLSTDKDLFAEKLSAYCESMVDETDAGKIAGKLMDFFKNLDFYIKGAQQNPAHSSSSDDTSVWLMRWTGQQEIEKWVMVDAEGGNAIQITECMHQTSLTKDYIVLTQTAFKFSLDLLINNPFPNIPAIDIIIRKILASTMLPYTDCYIVKRADLVSGTNKVVAHKLVTPPGSATPYPIPVETIHYSCNYANPNGMITLYGIHNSCSCVAEWIRPYDTAQITGEPVNNDLIGMFALGSMDINRIGKWVINVNTLSIDTANSKQYYSPGNVLPQNIGSTDIKNTDIGPNTWTLGLYTFRDMISPVKTVDQLKYIWYIANGADPEYLTEFIYDLYKNASDRILPVNEVQAFTAKGVAQTLVQIGCDTMTPLNHFQFPYGTYIRSLSFIPRPTLTPLVEYEVDGYIMCTMQVPTDAVNYRSEYWVFDAAKIASGPVCKLYFNGIQFCFTLHTAWMASASPYNFNYDVDVKTDYDAEINEIFSDDPATKAEMLAFFEKNVYEDWYKQKNGQSQ